MRHPDPLPARIAQGWTCMLAAFASAFLMTLVRDAVAGDFSRWATDPGPLGARSSSILLALYIVMPMLVRHADARWFRWLATGLAGFCGLFIVTHQLAHALTDSRPFDVLHVFDFVHHALALWVVILSARWARAAAAAPQPATVAA